MHLAGSQSSFLEVSVGPCLARERDGVKGKQAISPAPPSIREQLCCDLFYVLDLIIQFYLKIAKLKCLKSVCSVS